MGANFSFLETFLPMLATTMFIYFSERPPEGGPQHSAQATLAIRKEYEMASNDSRKREAAAKTEEEKRLATLQRLANENALREEMRRPVTSQDLIRSGQEKFGIDVKNNWNVLFCGQSGTGKSSAIKALFGLKPGSHGAPKASVCEGTAEMANYKSPKFDHLVIWDAPGCGTESFPFYHPRDPKLNYYQRFCVYSFHLVVLFYSDRLTEGVAQLAKMCL